MNASQSTFPPRAAHIATATETRSSRSDARRPASLASLAQVALGGSSAESLVRAIAIALLVLSVVAAVQAVVLAPPAIVSAATPVLAAAALLYWTAYLLGRHARVRSAAWMIVCTQVLVPPTVLANLPTTAIMPMSTAAWSSVAILTASAILGARAVLASGLAVLVGFVTGIEIASGFVAPVDEGALFIVVVTVATYVYARHRDVVETQRREILEARNNELEHLRANLEERVIERTKELANAAEELTRAYDAQRAQYELLVRTEKMAAVGRLTAGIAHELASPLQAILGGLEDTDALRCEYEASIDDPSVTPNDHAEIASEMREALDLIRMGAQRCVRYVASIRAHTRDPGPRAVERFNAASVAVEAVELLAHAARTADVRVVVEHDDEFVEIEAVPSRFHQVVTNLVQNAIDASAEARRGGVVSVRIARDRADLVLSIADDGRGIHPDVAPKIFEPMFTTKPYGKGTGLGLSIVRDIVTDELRGTVEARNQPEGGAAFIVRAPAARG